MTDSQGLVYKSGTKRDQFYGSFPCNYSFRKAVFQTGFDNRSVSMDSCIHLRLTPVYEIKRVMLYNGRFLNPQTEKLKYYKYELLIETMTHLTTRNLETEAVTCKSFSELCCAVTVFDLEVVFLWTVTLYNLIDPQSASS